jgi:hypothetical protein
MIPRDGSMRINARGWAGHKMVRLELKRLARQRSGDWIDGLIQRAVAATPTKAMTIAATKSPSKSPA